MTWHTIADGEDILSIAEQYGFTDWKRIYYARDNDELRRRCPDPDALEAGVRVCIPEPRAREEQCATGQSHTFRAKEATRMLRLLLEDPDRQPLRDQAVELTLDDAGQRSARTDGEGKLEVAIPRATQHARVRVGELSWEVSLESLPRLDVDADDHGEAGARARLANLGYTGELAEALGAFQSAQGLDATGQLDEDTRARLRQVHGS